MPGTTQSDIDNWFTYHAPKGDQQERYVRIRDYAKGFAELILKTTPNCADQTAAMRSLRELVMKINLTIACND